MMELRLLLLSAEPMELVSPPLVSVLMLSVGVTTLGGRELRFSFSTSERSGRFGWSWEMMKKRVGLEIRLWHVSKWRPPKWRRQPRFYDSWPNRTRSIRIPRHDTKHNSWSRVRRSSWMQPSARPTSKENDRWRLVFHTTELNLLIKTLNLTIRSCTTLSNTRTGRPCNTSRKSKWFWSAP